MTVDRTTDRRDLATNAPYAAMTTLMIQRTPVDSASLASIGYSIDARILETEFQQGDVYRFFEVPLQTFEALCGAESKGAYFNRAIRNRYAHQKVGR